jgi:hypothetical protein
MTIGKWPNIINGQLAEIMIAWERVGCCRDTAKNGHVLDESEQRGDNQQNNILSIPNL